MEYHPMEIREKEGGREMIKGFRIPPEGISMEKVEEALIWEALAMTEGNQTKAARLLNISRDSLRYRMHKFGIDRSVSNHSFEKDIKNNKETDKLAATESRSLLEGIAEKVNNQDRRGFERKQVSFPACIGESPSKDGKFAMGTILDISMGGIRFSVSKDAKREVEIDGNMAEFSISFPLPNNHWPIGVKCRLKRVVESANDVQIGAAFVDTDIRSHHSLQRYLN
jgi:hypothetical protein